jgi:hypothetical protein
MGIFTLKKTRVSLGSQESNAWALLDDAPTIFIHTIRDRQYVWRKTINYLCVDFTQGNSGKSSWRSAIYNSTASKRLLPKTNEW